MIFQNITRSFSYIKYDLFLYLVIDRVNISRIHVLLALSWNFWSACVVQCHCTFILLCFSLTTHAESSVEDLASVGAKLKLLKGKYWSLSGYILILVIWTPWGDARESINASSNCRAKHWYKTLYNHIGCNINIIRSSLKKHN